MADALPMPARSARERILDSAYELFSHRGIRAVGIDEIRERADVAKATLYRHFASKDDLVLAFLDRREQLWTREWVEREARARAADRKANSSRSSTPSTSGSTATTSKAAPSLT